MGARELPGDPKLVRLPHASHSPLDGPGLPHLLEQREERGSRAKDAKTALPCRTAATPGGMGRSSAKDMRHRKQSDPAPLGQRGFTLAVQKPRRSFTRRDAAKYSFNSLATVYSPEHGKE